MERTHRTRKRICRIVSSLSSTKSRSYFIKKGITIDTNPEEKWQEVSIDFITDLPKTAGGKDCIFVAVDKATRMVKLAPCSKTITAFKTAKLFWQTVVKNYGIPRVVYSDRGAQFIGRVWKELWSLTGTQLKYSTSYHPQTQGVVERMNSMIGQTLRCLTSEEKERD